MSNHKRGYKKEHRTDRSASYYQPPDLRAREQREDRIPNKSRLKKKKVCRITKGPHRESIIKPLHPSLPNCGSYIACCDCGKHMRYLRECMICKEKKDWKDFYKLLDDICKSCGDKGI